MPTFAVRSATPDDVPAMAAMAAELVRLHHALDPRRFMLPDDVEGGYRQWYAGELRSTAVVMRVAVDEGKVLGYVYARLETRDWDALRDACGAVHDIFVEPGARRAGVGEALLAAALEALRALGAPRVVLGTAWDNGAAQRLFTRAGFRKTMVEMTCEL